MPTRLQQWLDANGFTSAQLEAETGISRQSMTKIRAKGDVRRRTMTKIRRGAQALKGGPVGIEELFDLDAESHEGSS